MSLALKFIGNDLKAYWASPKYTYINKVLKRFQMKDCSPSVAPIVKGEKFSHMQCPKNELDALTIESLMYLQVVPDMTFHLL